MQDAGCCAHRVIIIVVAVVRTLYCVGASERARDHTGDSCENFSVHVNYQSRNLKYKGDIIVELNSSTRVVVVEVAVPELS